MTRVLLLSSPLRHQLNFSGKELHQSGIMSCVLQQTRGYVLGVKKPWAVYISTDPLLGQDSWGTLGYEQAEVSGTTGLQTHSHTSGWLSALAQWAAIWVVVACYRRAIKPQNAQWKQLKATFLAAVSPNFAQSSLGERGVSCGSRLMSSLIMYLTLICAVSSAR